MADLSKLVAVTAWVLNTLDSNLRIRFTIYILGWDKSAWKQVHRAVDLIGWIVAGAEGAVF